MAQKRIVPFGGDLVIAVGVGIAALSVLALILRATEGLDLGSFTGFCGVTGLLVGGTMAYWGVKGRGAVRAFGRASTTTEAKVLHRYPLAHRDEYGHTSHSYHVTVRFAADRQPVTLDAMVSEETYRATEAGGILTIQYANADPRVALLENEIDAYPNLRSSRAGKRQHKTTDADGYYDQGTTYYLLGEYEKALAEFSVAIELNPEDATFHHSQGRAYRWLFEYEKALAAYDKAIELNPELAGAYFDRGYLYKMVGQVGDAINDFERLLELTDDPVERQVAEQHLRDLRVGRASLAPGAS